MTWERDFGCVTGRDKGINANVLDHHPEIRDSVGFGGGVAYIYIYVYIYIYTNIYIIHMYIYMGSCQNYGPFLGTLNSRCRTILGTQKGTIILTTTHIHIYIYIYIYVCFLTVKSPSERPVAMEAWTSKVWGVCRCLRIAA